MIYNLRNNQSFDSPDYQKESQNVAEIQTNFNLYGSIIPLLALFVSMGYLIYHQHKERFQITIVAVMTLKYTLHIVRQVMSLNQIQGTNAVQVLLYSLDVSTGPISHWIYASQYMKTCCLVPGLVKRARLLLQRHCMTIANEYERTNSV